MEIVPAILEKDFSSIIQDLDKLVELKKKYSLDFTKVQIDLANLDFVSNQTYLFEDKNLEEGEKTIKSYRRFFDLEYHLMCKEQLKYFNLVKDLGAKSIVIHIDEIFQKEELREIINIAKTNYIEI